MPADLRGLPPLESRPTEKIPTPADETPIERLRRIQRELVEDGRLVRPRPALTMIEGGSDGAR